MQRNKLLKKIYCTEEDAKKLSERIENEMLFCIFTAANKVENRELLIASKLPWAKAIKYQKLATKFIWSSLWNILMNWDPQKTYFKKNITLLLIIFSEGGNYSRQPIINTSHIQWLKSFNRHQYRHVPLNHYREIEDAVTSSSGDSNPWPSDPSDEL